MKALDNAIFMSANLPAALKLDAINETVEFYEKTIGPLVLMKIDNDSSLFKFAATEPRPKNFAKVAKQVDGKPQLRDGEKLVTTGRVFIEGKQELCAAVRVEQKEAAAGARG